MPALHDRSGRPLPSTADVVVIGGGYAGVTAARELARRGRRRHAPRGPHARLGRIDAQRRHRPRRLQMERGPADQALRAGHRSRPVPGDARLVPAREAVDRGRGASTATSASRPPGARVCAPHVLSWSMPARASPRSASDRRSCPASSIHAEIGSDAYFGALAVEGSGLLHPGRYFGGLAAAADRAGADLHEGVRRKADRQGGRRLRRRDRARRHPGTRRLRGDERLYRWRHPIAAQADHPDRLVHHRVRALPEDLAHELSPKGRAFFDTKNFLYYWHVSADRRMVFGGRASFMPTTIDRTAAILWRGLLEVHPQMAGHRIEYAVGRQCRVHVRSDAPRRADEGRGHVRDGLLWDRRRADDEPGNEVGAWLAGDEAPALTRSATSRWCRRLRGPTMVHAVRRGVVPPAGPTGGAHP